MPSPFILLAEDDEIDVLLLSRAFQAAELENLVVRVRDGQEAIERLIAWISADEQLPTLAILDIKMPRCDGFGALAWIRGHPAARCLPVLMHSTSDHPAESERAYRQGANGYIVKSSDGKERLEMARFVKGWLSVLKPCVASVEGAVAARAFT